jgi:putative transposase for IS1016
MRKSRLSQYKQNKLIELFVAGVTARTAAELVGVNKNTAAYYFIIYDYLLFTKNANKSNVSTLQNTRPFIQQQNGV